MEEIVAHKAVIGHQVDAAGPGPLVLDHRINVAAGKQRAKMIGGARPRDERLLLPIVGNKFRAAERKDQVLETQRLGVLRRGIDRGRGERVGS